MYLQSEPTRFAEHVAREIEAGRFVGDSWMRDDLCILSPGYDICSLYNDKAQPTTPKKDSFSLTAWRGGWLWRKKRARLSRGDEYNLPITEAEQERLYYVYEDAKRVHAQRKRDKADAKVRERQRLTDWP